MAWYEMKVKTNSGASDAVIELMKELGAAGTAVEDPNDPVFKEGFEGSWDYFDSSELKFEYEGALVKGYFETEEMMELAEGMDAALEALAGFGLDPAPADVSFAEIFENDWANEWKKYFKPIRIGQHLVIKPSWETFDAKEDDILVEIDPGGAFGSGTHETTAMCMELLEKHVTPNTTVFDIGCGSGILAVTAAKLGAGKIIAGDIDQAAVDTSIENAQINGVKDMTVRKGDLLSVAQAEGKADIVVANIIADIIISMIPDVPTSLNENGIFISSGIIDFKLDAVLEALEAGGYMPLEVLRKGSWAAIAAKKK